MNWVPDLEAGKINRANQEFHNLRVSDLLNPEGEWDTSKLNDWFLPFEKEAIRRVHLAGLSKEDKRFWIYDKKGKYTVKTGYWSIFNKVHQDDTQSDPTCSAPKSTIWSNIWNLKIPPKVKMFLWRVLHDIIPTEVNLYRHHVPNNPRCALCGYYWSNTSHALFFCQEIKKLWNYSKWWIPLKRTKDLPTQLIMQYIKDSFIKDDWEIFCMRMWGVWKDRCNIIHHKSMISKNPCPQDHWSDSMYKSFKAIMESDRVENSDLTKRYGLISHEDKNKYHSLHTDAAFNYMLNKYAYGYIIRDSNHERRKAEGDILYECETAGDH